MQSLFSLVSIKPQEPRINLVTYECPLCTKRYKYRTNLSAHMKHAHADQKYMTPEDSHRNTFGSEDIAYLGTPAYAPFMATCLMQLEKGIVSLIEEIYCNKARPENNTIRVKSTTRKTFEIFHAERCWIEVDWSTTLDTLIYDVVRKHLAPFLQKKKEDKDQAIMERSGALDAFVSNINVARNTKEYFKMKRSVLCVFLNKKG
jgi:hypothetical protein